MYFTSHLLVHIMPSCEDNIKKDFPSCYLLVRVTLIFIIYSHGCGEHFKTCRPSNNICRQRNIFLENNAYLQSIPRSVKLKLKTIFPTCLELGLSWPSTHHQAFFILVVTIASSVYTVEKISRGIRHEDQEPRQVQRRVQGCTILLSRVLSALSVLRPAT